MHKLSLKSHSKHLQEDQSLNHSCTSTSISILIKNCTLPIVARLTEVVDVNEQENSVIGKQLKFSC